jgi:hypothetical protein
MSTEHDSRDRALNLISKMQGHAIQQFELELAEMRATMIAMTAYFEQSLTRFRDARLIPFDAVSQIVTDLADAADAERSHAARIGEDLEAARRQIDSVRAESVAEIRAAREAEARVRQDLRAIQTRNQEIVDTQMLRLVELKRELEAVSADTDRVRIGAEPANKETVARLSQKAVPPQIDLEPAPSRHHLSPLFSAIESALAETPPVPAAWEERVGA